jgi:nicotinamidase-related amidase
MDRQLLVNNIVGTAKAALTYGLPIVHSTVNVKTGLNKPPIPQLRKVLEEFTTYDRTSINSWEDVEFRKAVEATGRRKLIMTGLWTEAWLTFPTLDIWTRTSGLPTLPPSCDSAPPSSFARSRRASERLPSPMSQDSACVAPRS